MRDDFSPAVKDTLAKRVGYRCSNPNCRKLTSGPQETIDKAINIGVAAHITAASPGGKRYDPSLTPDERKRIENGIWLCQSCGKLIDSDEVRYTIDLLRQWKNQSEQAALLDIEQGKTDTSENMIVVNSPGSIVTKNQHGNNYAVTQVVDFQPKLYFFQDQTVMKRDEVTGLYQVDYFFGSNQGVALRNVSIELQFDAAFTTSDSAIVGTGMVSAGLLQRRIAPNNRGYTFETDVLRAENYVRIRVTSESHPKIIRFITRP